MITALSDDEVKDLAVHALSERGPIRAAPDWKLWAEVLRRWALARATVPGDPAVATHEIQVHHYDDPDGHWARMESYGDDPPWTGSLEWCQGVIRAIRSHHDGCGFASDEDGVRIAPVT